MKGGGSENQNSEKQFLINQIKPNIVDKYLIVIVGSLVISRDMS